MACEGKLGNCNFFQEEEDEEEALSLSDLPINLNKEERNNKSDVDEESQPLIKCEEDFDFRSWSRESEMCAADDVFFQGQILPLRHSISSENGLTKFNPETLKTSHWVSRSESMDHYGSLGGFSSRSSSTKSHYSSSSTSSTSTTTARNPKPRIRNQFHTHPSPKPQIRVSTTPLPTNLTRRSTIWEFFRVGLVRTPGIEFQDLKARSSISRNSSSDRSNTGHSEQSTNMEKQGKQRKHMFFDRERLLGGCSCSVGSAVKPVPQKIVVIRSNFEDSNHNIKGSARESKEHIEKQLQELKKKKKLMMEKQQGKQNESRHHRTFEWIKQLSHGSGHPDS
ncbi:hypothetical protein HS088_TW13G01140 [Tripterygium wilfordii]|uniref:Uncharacterized protein n=1 Tax=Tripterygium wilfordii TaxID=458696 RepID=A0A7J7CW49_TRIWF|nr:uncharacterized protein LOC120012615 [Tripterygium wilfordii]KAF5738244.1 hypothetical protein HS088_TW13G01140 [Tripterygium wilfordii]